MRKETSAPHLKARHQQFEAALPTEPIWLEADAARLIQVLVNLLNNAAKYTDEGGRIWLAVERDAADSRYVLIRVRDNGRGLDREAIASLFELFYQVQGNLDRSDGGLGVGLALVRSIVERHEGTVEAHSAGRGQGSEFIVRMPCADRSITAPAAQGRRNQGRRNRRHNR